VCCFVWKMVLPSSSSFGWCQVVVEHHASVRSQPPYFRFMRVALFNLLTTVGSDRRCCYCTLPRMAASPPTTKCVPCEGLDDSHKLSLDQVRERLAGASFPLWTCMIKEEEEEGDASVPRLSRSFVARSFQAALDAINAMGIFAEQEGHHPDFHLTSYRNVQIDLYTHDLAGITENDFALASLLDTVPIDYSPKWLKAHPEAAASSKKKPKTEAS
jgi:4a-hydroxytetrahydrobiopterin dehydratase